MCSKITRLTRNSEVHKSICTCLTSNATHLQCSTRKSFILEIRDKHTPSPSHFLPNKLFGRSHNFLEVLIMTRWGCGSQIESVLSFDSQTIGSLWSTRVTRMFCWVPRSLPLQELRSTSHTCDGLPPCRTLWLSKSSLLLRPVGRKSMFDPNHLDSRHKFVGGIPTYCEIVWHGVSFLLHIFEC